MPDPIPTYAETSFALLREQMRTTGRGRTACLLAAPDGQYFPLGWDENSTAGIINEPNSVDAANIAIALSSGIPLREVGATNFDVATFLRVESITNNPDIPGRPAQDMVNIRVETADGTRVIPVPELTLLQAIAVAHRAPFVEHHVNGASGGHARGDARHMYTLTFPRHERVLQQFAQSGLYPAEPAVVLPLPSYEPGTEALNNESEFRTFVRDALALLISNDMSIGDAAPARPTYYATALLSEQNVPNDVAHLLERYLKNIEGLKDSLTHRLFGMFVGDARLDELTQLAPEAARAKLKSYAESAMAEMSLSQLIRINRAMLEQAERIFYPNAPVDMGGLLHQPRLFDDRGFQLIHRETGVAVIAPGYKVAVDKESGIAQYVLTDGVEGLIQRPKLKPNWSCVMEQTMQESTLVPTFKIVPSRGWRKKRDGTLETANGFYLGTDGKPHLLPGYAWNPNTREGELFIR